MKANIRHALLFSLCPTLLFVSGACGEPTGAGPLGPFPPPPPPGDIDRALIDALGRAGIRPPDGAGPALPGDAANSAMVALGEALFYDPVLSGDQNISCATCHHPAAGTGDGLPLSIGAGGVGTASARVFGSGTHAGRNAPHLFALAGPGGRLSFWDGRVQRDPTTGALSTPEARLNGSAPDLASIAQQLTSATAAQALFPLVSNEEMRGQPGNEIRDAADNATAWSRLVERLVGTANGTSGGSSSYRALFAAAYPEVAQYDDFHIGHVGRAIAAFEFSAFRRGGPNPGAFGAAAFDRYVAGDREALTFEEKRGALTFFGRRGACARCHRGPELSDFRFHSIAAPQIGPGPAGAGGDDLGRFAVTGNAADVYTFKTPSLRNVELTAPYTHSGAYASLEALLRHYGDPVLGARSYDATQLRADFASLVDGNPARLESRIAALSPELREPPRRFSPEEIREVVAFLRTLTDPAARAGVSTPATAVSGLPVAH